MLVGRLDGVEPLHLAAKWLALPAVFLLKAIQGVGSKRLPDKGVKAEVSAGSKTDPTL